MGKNKEDEIQSIELQDGERISFSTIGPSNGTTFVVFPGAGNHRDFLLLYEPIAYQYNLFFINLDRPGSGLSKSISRDLLTDRMQHVTSNTLAVLNHLDIKGPIYLMGHCCGFLYALGVGLALREENQQDSLFFVKSIFAISPWISLSRSCTNYYLRSVRNLPQWLLSLGTKSTTSFMSCFLRSICPDTILNHFSDREKELFIQNPIFGQLLYQIIAKANKEDEGGEAADMMFCLEKIEPFPQWKAILSETPIVVFHGDDDHMVPLPAVEEEFDRSNMILNVVKGGKHTLLFDVYVWEEIVAIVRNEGDVMDRKMGRNVDEQTFMNLLPN